MRHETSERRSPVAILLSCSCGWSRQITRRQNALARAAKVGAAWREHSKTIEADNQLAIERRTENVER